ncbi:MAG: Fe-S cluster assembly ATPase SufC [Parcubacteria group bacterium]|nr:Fe-S cluster assembly ATPase SufC [Parcubacteria group bacterium]
MHKLFTLSNLTVALKSGKQILSDINLFLKCGEIIVLLGPNGSGKSSLCSAIIGDPQFKIVGGKIIFDGKRINRWPTEKRVRAGIFLGYQTIPALSGVRVDAYLQQLLFRKNMKLVAPRVIEKQIDSYLALVDLDSSFKERYLYNNFSGGEKKKMQIVEALILEPRLLILDEIDAGLDIGAKKDIIRIVKKFKRNECGVVCITHSIEMARAIRPTRIYVMRDGKIVDKGDTKLISKIEKSGFYPASAGHPANAG